MKSNDSRIWIAAVMGMAMVTAGLAVGYVLGLRSAPPPQTLKIESPFLDAIAKNANNPPPPKAAPEPAPTPFDEPLAQKDIEFSIVSAEIGKPEYKEGFNQDLKVADQAMVVVRFRVKNLSDRLRYFYVGRYLGDMKDDLGNIYKAGQLPGPLAGAPDDYKATLDPGGSFIDVRCFEPPLPKAQTLVLSLPQQLVSREPDSISIYGMDGYRPFDFQIPIARLAKVDVAR